MLIISSFSLTCPPPPVLYSAMPSSVLYTLDWTYIKSLFCTSTFYSYFCGDMVNICICLMLDKAPILLWCECTLQFAWAALIMTLQLWLVSHLSNNFKSINHTAFFLMWSNVKCFAEVKRYVPFISLFYEAYYLIKGRNKLAWHDLFLWIHTTFLH